MGDLISRRELLDDIGRAYYDSAEDVIDIIKEAEAKDKWVPCGGALPEMDEYFLAYDVWGTILIGKNDGGTFREMDGYGRHPNEIAAWQPLPEPYKADIRGEE